MYQAICVIKDFAKQLDTIHIQLLVAQDTRKEGIRHELLKSYLSEKRQCVKTDKAISTEKTV